MTANRWLRLRHPNGFDEPRFAQFVAHCDVFEAYVASLLRNWRRIGAGDYNPPTYEFGEPEMSSDRRIVSLPLGGVSTLGSRAAIENGSSQLLWRFFPGSFRKDLDEGLSEDIGKGLETFWRKVPDLFVRYLETPERQI